MSTLDWLASLLAIPAESLPPSLRAPLGSVTLTHYVIVEASRLDGIDQEQILAWLGLSAEAFEAVEEGWSERIADALTAEGSTFDEVYEDLLGRALELWPRAVDPLDRKIEAYLTYQRHNLETEDLGQRLGLTTGDEIRLGRLWAARLADPEVAAQAQAASSVALPPLPEVVVVPVQLPVVAELASKLSQLGTRSPHASELPS